MSKYRAYPVYKDSGVEWLGEVPEHWEVLSLKRLTIIQRGASPRPIQDQKYFDDEGEFAWVRISDVTASNHYLETTTQRLSELGASFSICLQPNQLFLSIAGSVGKPIITKIKCCIHDGFVYFPNLEQSSEFLYYIFETGQPYLGLGKLGTQLNLNTDTVGAIKIGLPDIKEQQQIAAFLDNKTAHLDSLIEKKQQMIGLLNEKRISLITQAVTKGLDLSAPMKDSGVEWLGNVPEHWEKVLIKYLLNSMIDTEHKTAPFFEDGQYFVVRTSNIRNGKLLFNNAKYTDHAGYIEWTRRGKPQAGDILFTREAPAGEACIVPEGIDLCVGQRTVLMQVNPNLLNSKYALWSLYGGLAAEFIKILSQGATVAHFNMSDIGNIPILLPLIDEQQKIVDFLDHETAKIDRMINTVQSAITKLQEYRTALITAAVTGKIDVRTLTLHEG